MKPFSTMTYKQKAHWKIPFLILFTFLLKVSFVYGQIEVEPAITAPFTPESLIENVFLGEGIYITSIEFNGEPRAVGYFSDGMADIGFEEGFFLTTGEAFLVDSPSATTADGTNESNAFSSELARLADGKLEDVAEFVIKFIPTTDSIEFKYRFASEEYPEFGCDCFNDVFGFYIYGPGIDTNGENIAVLPETNESVSVKTIHPLDTEPGNGAGCPSSLPPCEPVNEHLYIDNVGNQNLVYDGFTQTLVARAKVEPCEEYILKIAIADVEDPLLDSGVFLESKSFNSNNFEVKALGVGLDGSIVEGCSTADLVFTLPQALEEDYIINLTKIGSATAGQDYVDFPNEVTISAGELSTSVEIEALGDQTIEANDSIGIEIEIAPCLTKQIWIPIKDAQLALPELGTDLNICPGDSVQLFGEINQISDTITSFEEIGINETIREVQEDRSNPVNSIPSFFPLEISGINPSEVVPDLIHSICVNINHVRVGEIDIFLETPTGKFIELSTDNGGLDDHYRNTCFTGDALQKITEGTAPFTGDYLPEGNWASLYGETTNGTWNLIVRDDEGIGGTGNIMGTMLNWSINFNPNYQVSYQWQQADSISCIDCPNPFVFPSQTTQYTLNASDSYGCTSSDDIRVNIQEELAAPVVSCENVTESSITISWEQVLGADTYEVNIDSSSWTAPNLGNFQHQITNLQKDESVHVQVRGTANNNCGALTEMVTCVTTNCIVPTIQLDSIQNVGCKGGIDGQIFVSSGVNAFFVLGTDTSQLGQNVTFSTLAANDYQIYVLDANKSCGDTLIVRVEEPIDVLNSQITGIQPISCFSANDGSINISVNGGTAPYSYNWFNSKNELIPAPDSVILENLPSDEYRIQIVDNNNCSQQLFLPLPEPEAIIEDSLSLDESCFGLANGSASIMVNPNYNSLSFFWSNNENTPIINNLSAGTYSVRVLNDAGCEETRNLIISTPPEIILNEVSSNPASCSGKNDGEATVLAQGGTGNFSYQWNDALNQGTATASQLIATIYEVIATDDIGCMDTIELIISAQSDIVLDTMIQAISCFEAEDGSIDLNINGGTPTYKIQWSDNLAEDQTNRSNLPAGVYQVSVKDINDCATGLQFTIGNKAAINLVVNQDSASCNAADGKISIGIIGNSSYIFQWEDDPTRTTASAENLRKGNYKVTVTDEFGCETSQDIMLGEKAGIQLSSSTTPVICSGERTGTATVMATGGSGNYLYLWDDPAEQENPIAINLAAGSYMILVLDNNGCEQSIPVEVPDASIPIEINFDKQDISCFGAIDGQINAQVDNNLNNLSYQWSSGESSPNLINKAAANYFLTITDINGCEHWDSVGIIEPEEFFAETMITPISCPGNEDGQFTIIPMGGTAPYQFSIDGNRYAPFGEFTDLRSGNYEPAIRDANNCSVPLASFQLDEALPLSISISDLQIKAGESTQLLPIVENGNGVLSFIWSGNNLTDLSCIDCPNPLLNPTNSQMYKLNVVDEAGCEAATSIRVLVEKNRKIYVPTGFSPNRDGHNDRLTVHGVEGTHILTFKIFDRWGELVFFSDSFEVNDEAVGWDGTFKGQPLNTNVFAWIVEVKFSDGAVEMVKGHSTLIR